MTVYQDVAMIPPDLLHAPPRGTHRSPCPHIDSYIHTVYTENLAKIHEIHSEFVTPDSILTIIYDVILILMIP